MHIGTTTVLRMVRAQGHSPRKVSATRPWAGKRFSPADRKVVCRKYRSGASLGDLAKEYKVTINAVRRVLIKAGIKRRAARPEWKKVTKRRLATMVRLWSAGNSQTAIAEKFGLTQDNVSRLFETAGVAVDVRYARGSRHGMWRGGIWTNNDGYVFERIAHDDPMASMRLYNGYVAQHRLVMARYLGRPLHRWETVHHKDRDRKHNKIGNLQLRIGKHGHGVAYACADCGSRRLIPIDLD